MASITVNKTYASPTGPAVDVLVEYGFRYHEEAAEDPPGSHSFVTVRKRVAFARYQVPGDEAKELTRSVTDAQFNALSVKQLEALVLAAIKTDLGV